VDEGGGAPVEDPLDDFSAKIEAFRVFAGNDQARADEIFESLGGKGRVERDMVQQLGWTRPLHKPDQFERAHRTFMKSVEVLYRNGHRPAAFGGWGPLQPLSDYLIQLVTRFIVRNQVQALVDAVQQLYLRRWTSSPHQSVESEMLRRAARQIEEVAPGYKGRSLGLPTFLLGGAFVSSVTGVLGSLVESGASNRPLLAVVGVLLYAFLVFAGWCVVRGAAVARRRIRLSLEQPVAALWDVVGAAGDPPKDQSAKLALGALVVMGLTAVVLPVAVVLLFVVG
jgi:hypothetical protein